MSKRESISHYLIEDNHEIDGYGESTDEAKEDM